MSSVGLHDGAGDGNDAWYGAKRYIALLAGLDWLEVLWERGMNGHAWEIVTVMVTAVVIMIHGTWNEALGRFAVSPVFCLFRREGQRWHMRFMVVFSFERYSTVS